MQTSVCKKIVQRLKEQKLDQKVAILSQDSFYHDLTDSQRQAADEGLYNFDHPGVMSVQLASCMCD